MSVSTVPSYGSCLTMTDDEVALVQERLYPKKWSGVGFLGTDEKLREVVQTDKEALESVGITFKQVADRMTSLWHRYDRVQTEAHDRRSIEEIMSRPVSFSYWSQPGLIDGIFQVQIGGLTMGHQPCPFMKEKECGQGNGDIRVLNTTTKEEVVFVNLLPHLVGVHHFFEGNPGACTEGDAHTSYRTDPLRLCKVLEIEPGVDYAPAWKTERVWQMIMGDSVIEEKELAAAEEFAEKTFEIDKECRAYLLPYGGTFDFERFLYKGFTKGEAVVQRTIDRGKSAEEAQQELKKKLSDLQKPGMFGPPRASSEEEAKAILNEPNWVDEGKKYLHVFSSHERCLGTETLGIDGGTLKARDVSRGHNVFEARSEQKIQLGPDDRMLD